jgi:MFS family permease
VTTAAVEPPRAGYRKALRSRQFRAIFAAQTISIAGASVASVALTVLIFRRTGSPFLSSLTFALGFLPFLFSGTLLSSLVDRIRPRRIVNACDALSAVIAGTMAIPGMPVAALLALLFALGSVASLGNGARGPLVRATVTDAAYVPARSLMRIASQSAQIGGNALGGALVVVLGTSGAILVNAASFAVSFALVRVLVADHPNLGEAASSGLLRDSIKGAKAVFSHAEIARFMVLGWVVPLFSVAPEALAAPYVSAHHGSTSLVGWWLAALPVGIIAGDVAGVRFLRPAAQRRIVVPVAAAGFVPYLFFVFHPAVSVGLALLVLSGLSGMYALGLDGRLRNATPDGLFPRMMALSTAGLMTLQGLGFALAGAVGEFVSSGTAIALAGVFGLAAVGLVRFWPAAGTSAEVPNLST